MFVVLFCEKFDKAELDDEDGVAELEEDEVDGVKAGLCFGVDGAVLALFVVELLFKLLYKLYSWFTGVVPVPGIGVVEAELVLEIPFSKLSSKKSKITLSFIIKK